MSPILLGLDRSNVGGACGSASDLPDPEEAGTSGEMETDRGEQYDGDVSVVQDSQSQPSQPRRSDTGLLGMMSESGGSHTEDESQLFTPCTRKGRRSFVWDHGG